MLFDLLLLALAAYVLWQGIVGKGKLYSLESIKEENRDSYVSKVKKLYIVLGVFMLLNSGMSLLRGYLYTYDATTKVYTPNFELGQFSFLTPELLGGVAVGSLVVTIALVVVLVILARKNTDKEAQKKAAEAAAQARKRGVTLPSCAFDFETPEKADASRPASDPSNSER